MGIGANSNLAATNVVSLNILSKKCSSPKCQAQNPQPISCFNKNKGMKDGYQNQCKKCASSASRRWATANPNKIKAKAIRLRRKWRAEDSASYSAKRRKWVLKAQYGLTIDDYNKMYLSQNGSCFICLRHSTEFPKGLVVDHDHQSGKVRNLLCGQCNQMLGQAKENIQTLRSAISYLEHHA